MADTTFLIQLGDRFPGDLHVEMNLRERLAGRVLGQQDLLDRYGDGLYSTDIAVRLDLLRRALADLAPGPVVLVGRSSGSRVATLATLAPEGAAVRAVICLGYPFRAPGQPVEDGRVGHLAGLATPTLIFQGRRDVYGGETVTRDYVLSPAVRVELLDAEHSMKLAPEVWDDVVARIGAFVAEA